MSEATRMDGAPWSRRDVVRVGVGMGLVVGLGGCQLPGSGPAPREFRLTPKTTFGDLPKVDWSLAVARTSAGPALDSTRIAVKRTGVEVEYFADARWVDRPAAMLQPLLIQSFRSSGAIAVVGDDRAAFRPNFVLSTDISAFQAIEGENQPAARVAIASSLLQMPRREVVGTTEVGRTVEAAAGDLNAITEAFDDALGKVMKRIVEWTLTTGQEAISAG